MTAPFRGAGEDRALFLRDGDAYVGTFLTEGGWDPAHANGGTVLALLGQCLDDVPSLVPMTVSRFTADLVRPVPVGQRLHVVPTVVREGKKIQVVELRLVVGGVEHVRATILRLREADLSGLDGLPSSTTDDRPADVLFPPDESISYRDPSRTPSGFMLGIDMRRAPRRDGPGFGAWIRLDAAVVAGEPVSPTAQLAFGFDFANQVGVVVDDFAASVTMINPDVTAHVLRSPTGEWVGITGETWFNPRAGRGISSAVLSDFDGVFAVASVSQLVQPRDP